MGWEGKDGHLQRVKMAAASIIICHEHQQLESAGRMSVNAVIIIIIIW